MPGALRRASLAVSRRASLRRLPPTILAVGPDGCAAGRTNSADPAGAARRKARLAKAEGLESVVLFALDQFALIGYPAPLGAGMRRAAYQG